MSSPHPNSELLVRLSPRTGANVSHSRKLTRLVCSFQIAKGFVQAGARVYVASRKVPELAVSELNAAGKASGGQAFAISADLSKLDGVDKVVQTIKEKEGKLHVLVNNG